VGLRAIGRHCGTSATSSSEVQRSLDIEDAVVIGGTPDEFGTFMRTESQRSAALIERSRLTTD
jgi:hypothetical protein